ncbi:MAG: cyclic nucleotide-binding domain-containing protein [Rhizobiales bacterium]|nr:cyclic nucleotide-binding domain-containing protein [Hyphomicrobiales bacterium]
MDLVSFGNAFGHLSYLILALSYWLTNIYWLRVVAVLGSALEIIYFSYTGGDLAVGIGWTVVFIAINVFHLVILTKERLSLRLPEADAPLLRESLSGLTDFQIAKLLRAADWKNYVAGDVLTRQDAPVDALYFLCRGRANVEVSGTFVTYLEKGTFIGEIAYLTGNPATATVTIDEPSRVLAFSKMKMARVVASDEQISGIMYQLLGRDLAMKMRRTNTRRVLDEDDPTRL